MGFLAPSTRVEVLRRFGTHLADDGRAVVGFGAGRGYEFSEFLSDVEAAGLRPRLVQGDATNLKVTYPLDLHLAEWILQSRQGQT